MGFDDLRALIAEHWPSLLAIGAILIPLIGTYFHFSYKNRLEELRAKIRKLEDKNSEKEPELPAKENKFSHHGIKSVWLKTNDESRIDLENRIRQAKKRITIFGLTRNFYASDRMRDLVVSKSYSVPIVMFMMHPECESRTDRYRIEPVEASFEDPKRYRREVERPFGLMLQRTTRIPAGSNQPGLGLYYYNFPCSFAIEEIDDSYRIMLYGHGVRGTESPVFLLEESSSLVSFFSSQLRWLEKLALRRSYAPWDSKNVTVEQIIFKPDHPDTTSAASENLGEDDP